MSLVCNAMSGNGIQEWQKNVDLNLMFYQTILL